MNDNEFTYTLSNDELRENTTKEILLDLKKDIDNKDLALVSTINKIKNPFKMLGVEDVMKDLNICRNIAYKVFQREDFPSINVGKNKQVMLISYLLWKMERKEWENGKTKGK